MCIRDSQEDVRRILARIETLRENPRPPGSEKLSGQERYRVRQGNYRILYTCLLYTSRCV